MMAAGFDNASGDILDNAIEIVRLVDLALDACAFAVGDQSRIGFEDSMAGRATK